MISDSMDYRLSGIHRDITNKMDSLKRKKAMGKNIDREVQRLEKFALDNGATKDWRYNSDNLNDVEKLAFSAYDRLCMDIDGYTGCETPEHKKRIDRMKEVFTTDSKERIEPTSVDDARRMISQTDDPNAIMEIIGTQEHLDRLELIKENWDKVGG